MHAALHVGYWRLCSVIATEMAGRLGTEASIRAGFVRSQKAAPLKPLRNQKSKGKNQKSKMKDRAFVRPIASAEPFLIFAF